MNLKMDFNKQTTVIFVLLATFILVSMLWIYKEFKETQIRIEDMSIKSQISYIEAITENMVNYILKSTNKDIYNSLKNSKKVREELNGDLSIFMVDRYKYIYLLKVDKKSHKLSFLLDGSKDDKALFEEPYTPQKEDMWEKLYKIKKPLYFKHKESSGLWITYLRPVVQKGKVVAVLVVDFSIEEEKNLVELLNSLSSTMKWFFIFSIFLFFAIVSFAIFNYRRELEKEKLHDEIKKFNEVLKNSILKATKRLRDENNNFEKLLDSIQEGIVIADGNGEIKWINSSMKKISKMKDEVKCKGKKLLDFIPDNYREKVLKNLDKDGYRPIEILLYDINKDIYPALVTGVNLIKNGKKHRASIILDLTDIKRKEQQIFQQTKLAQMGDMISMIAHQWRQPLNAISASAINLSMLSTMGELEDEKVQESSEFIQDKCQEMSKTINTFMDFIKPSSKKREFGLTEAIEPVVEIMKSQLTNHGINLEIVEEEKGLTVFGYRDLLEQVLLNLLSNSRDAFDKIGKVKEDKNIKDKFIKIVTKKEKDIVVIIVEDNAGGIPQDIASQIFNPYFTTKEEGKGTGIGLYMSSNIIKQSFKGSLEYKAIDGGTIFKIKFGGNFQ